MHDQTSLLPGRPKSLSNDFAVNKTNQVTYNNIGGSPEDLLKTSTEYARWLYNVSYTNGQHSYSRNDDKFAVIYLAGFMLIGLAALLALIFKHCEYDPASIGCQRRDNSLTSSAEEHETATTAARYGDLPPTYADSNSSSLIPRCCNDETLPPTYEEALNSALIGASVLLSECNTIADTV